MRLLVISFAPFVQKENHFYAYSPYIKEMAIWAKHVDEIAFVCPVTTKDRGLLISEVTFPVSKIFIAKAFNVKTFWNIILAFVYSFWNFYQLFRGMIWADHIHLRCPGNLGLMACVVQVFFPWKVKSAKYAGNWDPKSKQPIGYKLQQWLLSNTFLTKKMQVLVYGEWEGVSKNIKPFFTASYRESEKIDSSPHQLHERLEFIFVGTLSIGKRPLYAVQIIHELVKKGVNARFCLYGTGAEQSKLEKYITEYHLEEKIFLRGNYSHEEMKTVYQNAHFNILPSRSEGWPKVVAESMFWGCLPIATAVSCVPTMIGNGDRGLLLTMNFNRDVDSIYEIIQDQSRYDKKIEKGVEWSRKFTLDLFETEIGKLITV